MYFALSDKYIIPQNTPLVNPFPQFISHDLDVRRLNFPKEKGESPLIKNHHNGFARVKINELSV
jgi:hypothetical protein